ncbi:MAG: MBL fold metallo-hydrolase [Chitinophagales bacterium]|nr:MBL fold metallo-hydrolase [Chitinophagales bacterium]
MRIKILGCGDAFGTWGRLNTCFLLETSTHRYAIDFGATSMPALKSIGLDSNDIDGIILSHFHGDHYGGVTNFLLEAALIKKREKPLWIVSPPNVESMIKKLSDALYPTIYEHLPEIDLRFFYYSNDNQISFNEIELHSFPLIHSAGSSPHGFRIKVENRLFAFSGDTEWTDDLFKVSDGADIFICEANYYDKEGPGHLRYVDIIKNLKKFNCDNIYISHLGEDWSKEKMESAELSLLEDGQVIDF